MVEAELVEVADLNPEMSEIVCRNSEKLTVYYGEGDSWTPREFYEQFIEKFPDVKTIYGCDGFKHDFVLDLDSSEGVAELADKLLRNTHI